MRMAPGLLSSPQLCFSYGEVLPAMKLGNICHVHTVHTQQWTMAVVSKDSKV